MGFKFLIINLSSGILSFIFSSLSRSAYCHQGIKVQLLEIMTVISIDTSKNGVTVSQYGQHMMQAPGSLFSFFSFPCLGKTPLSHHGHETYQVLAVKLILDLDMTVVFVLP